MLWLHLHQKEKYDTELATKREWEVKKYQCVIFLFCSITTLGKIIFSCCFCSETQYLGLTGCLSGCVPSTFQGWEGMRSRGESVEVESSEETDSEFPFALFSRLLCLCKVAAIQYSYFLICTIGITGTDLLWSSDKSSACTAIKMAVITVVAIRLNKWVVPIHSTEKSVFLPPENRTTVLTL